MKEDKPDYEGCFNLSVGGYGGCATTITKKRRVLSPQVWAEMKSGPGFWITPEAVASNKKFVLRICEKTKMCSEEEKAEAAQYFDVFLNAPDIIEGKKKEPQ